MIKQSVRAPSQWRPLTCTHPSVTGSHLNLGTWLAGTWVRVGAGPLNPGRGKVRGCKVGLALGGAGTGRAERAEHGEELQAPGAG